jgi:response regulator of citrate/malate metabolism
MKDKKVMKIVVMEDNEMYNALLTKKIQLYTDSLSVDTSIEFKIFSYISLGDCIRNLKEDIDIIFLDYFLVKNITALDIFKKIKETCKHCKIFIISRTQDTDIISKAFKRGVDDFIFKDKYALAYSCYLIKKVVYDE